MDSVKTTRETFVRGTLVEANTVLAVPADITENEASQLISGGKALPVTDAPEAADENRENSGSKSSKK